MSSRKSNSSTQTGASTHRPGSTTHPSSKATHRSSRTTNRSSSTAHRTPEEQLASAVRSVVRNNGPEAAENIFNQALDHSSHSRSGGSGTSHSDGRSSRHRSSSSAHPSTASSRSSARTSSEHTRSSRDSSTSSHSHISSSSHRSGGSARSSSTADSTSTYTPSNYLDAPSSTSSRYSTDRSGSATSYIESIPEDDESSAQPDEGRDQLVPMPYGAPLGDLAAIGVGYNPRPGAHTVASFESSSDARGNIYNIRNMVIVVNIYEGMGPPPFGFWPPPPLSGWQCACCPAGSDGVYRGCRRVRG